MAAASRANRAVPFIALCVRVRAQEAKLETNDFFKEQLAAEQGSESHSTRSLPPCLLDAAARGHADALVLRTVPRKRRTVAGGADDGEEGEGDGGAGMDEDEPAGGGASQSYAADAAAATASRDAKRARSN